MSDSNAPAPTKEVIASAGETHDHGHGDHNMHLRLYWGIGGVLIFFTGLTVALSYADFDKWFGGHGWNMIIGMVVAAFKVSLVGAIFMHLKGEKSTIWRFLYFTLFFFLGLFLLTGLHWWNPIFGTTHTHH